jgi:hypothetical protein
MNLQLSILFTFICEALKRHLIPFLGFIAAFFLPVLPFIIALEVLAFGEYLTRKMLKRKKEIDDNGILSVAMMSGLAILLILLAQTCVIAFKIPAVFPLPKLIASYLCAFHMKCAIQNVDEYYGIKLWSYIINYINQFNPIKKQK